MNIIETLAVRFYEFGNNENNEVIRLQLYWQSFNYLVQNEKRNDTGLRQSIRDYLENHFDEIDPGIDYDDERLDEYFRAPLFEDGRIEADKDIYYYLDYNNNRVQYNRMNDYQTSIRNFQKLYNDMDLDSLFMTIFKVIELLNKKEDMKYSLREKNLIAGANYILKHTLDTMFQQ